MGKDLAPSQAIELMKAGASDSIKCPFHELELKVAVRQACEAQSLVEQINRERDRNIDNEIGRRLKTFSEFLMDKRKRGSMLTLGEIKLFSGKSGDKWVSHFRDLDPTLPVAMLTAYKNDIDLIVFSLRAGATDCLT